MTRDFYLLSASLMLSCAMPVEANIHVMHSDFTYSDVADGFVHISEVKTNQSKLIHEMAIAADAAYNDKNLVALKSDPLRAQIGNSGRESLAEKKETISFSSTTPGYGNLPAGILTYEVNSLGSPVITIAFHGTECIKDIVTDLAALKESAAVLCLQGYAHSGFLTRYMQSREAIVALINDRLEAHGKKSSDVEFRVTGHSLGGALATLCAADLKTNLVSTSKVKLVTFSSPRVLDPAGAIMLDNTLDVSLRIWRGNDPISTVSIGTQFGLGFMTGYRHTGKSIKLAAKTSFFSMKNHKHDWHKADAASDTEVPILQHTGWKDAFIGAISGVSSFFTSRWSKK